MRTQMFGSSRWSTTAGGRHGESTRALPEADRREDRWRLRPVDQTWLPSALAGASCVALNSMGDHHGNRRQRYSSRAVEQGQDRRAEGALQAEGHLGAARPSADGKPGARTRTVQPRHRQQAARMRPRRTQGPGCVPWRSGGNTRHRHAAQDPAPGAMQFEITSATREALQVWIK